MRTPTRKTPCGNPECIECYGNPEYTEEQIEVLNECKFVEDNLGSVSDVTRKLIHRLIECDTLVKREAKTDRRPVRQEPVAYLIDWPDEPDLGYYFSERPSKSPASRSRALYIAPHACSCQAGTEGQQGRGA